MTFSEQLNNYIEKINCSSQELSLASGLSSVVISRYRNGDRTPNIKSKQLEQLVDSLNKISCDKNINISKDEIYNSLSNTLNDVLIDFEQLSQNLNTLISSLNISVAELSRFIGYDASFISKIRTGSRNPSKPKDFIESVCNFIIAKYKSADDKKTVSILINCTIEDIKTDNDYFKKLQTWFSTNSVSNDNYINDFLNNVDSFDLNEYIKAIHFDELKIPFVPFYKSNSRTYYGIEKMKKGELDFFKATVLSKSNEPVFMCSDMPMEDMAKDIEFGKKWMFAIAMTLKKGLHLDIIHNIDRPFNEMMLGLESWIPIYMTGQVSPYYLNGFQDNTYCHLNYVSGAVALTGECIRGYHNKGKYYLTSSKSEVLYYKSKANCLLNKAKPLMEIYNADNKNAFSAFMSSNINTKGKRRRILPSLPLHTISDELLIKILKRNNISDEDINNIKSAVENERNLLENVLQYNIVEDEITELSKEEFERAPVLLSLLNDFYENKISYNYEEYVEHLNLTKKYNHANYKLTNNNFHTFKNIQLLVCENNWVMISKSNSPSIHFVIHHPKLRSAIENFIPPVIE